MSGYLGSEIQQRLQRRVDELAPGYVNSGRLVGTDNPDRIGWDSILAGFRILCADQDRLQGGSCKEVESERHGAPR
jgi:hypothetical protein